MERLDGATRNGKAPSTKKARRVNFGLIHVFSRQRRSIQRSTVFHQKGTVMGWLRYSPSDFVFTAKIPKVITHDKRLGLKGDVKSDLAGFLDVMRPLPLAGKLVFSGSASAKIRF